PGWASGVEFRQHAAPMPAGSYACIGPFPSPRRGGRCATSRSKASMSGRNRQHDRRAATADGVDDARSTGDEFSAADEALDPRQLRARLLEKEQLVEALTERLEQTAEQLDRARRTGN